MKNIQEMTGKDRKHTRRNSNIFYDNKFFIHGGTGSRCYLKNSILERGKR